MFKSIQTLKEKVIVIIAIILGSFILGACISAGALPLLGGVIGTVDRHIMMADCEKTTATYVKSVSSDPNDEEMQAFIYEFCVNEDVYWIETDYETSGEPEKGSKVTVYYNPSDPTEAIIGGMNGTVMALIVGTIC